MEVKLDEDGREIVLLSPERSTGAPMSKVQRVAIAAIALETHDPVAISRLTGIKKKQVKFLIHGLLETDWGVRTVDDWNNVNKMDATDANEAAFAILSKKGVAA